MATRIEWSGDREVRANMERYRDDVRKAQRNIGLYFAPQIESRAKADARWTDRTANARQSLRAYVTGEAPPSFGAGEAMQYPDEVDDADEIAIYLSHGMKYGLWLEVRFAGRYAIIEPTLRAFHAPVMQMIRDTFAG